MVGLVIAFPQMVMHYKGVVVDPGDVEIVVPEMRRRPDRTAGLGRAAAGWCSRRPGARPAPEATTCRSRRVSATTPAHRPRRPTI